VLGLLRPVFQQLIAGMLRRHPELFERLGEYGERVFLIDPVDLPVVFLMKPSAARPRLTPHGRNEALAWEAAVRGPLPKLISMVNGEEDGDALFFSRDIVIEGDTEAVLALRNAIDDAGIDLVEEAEALLGPFAGPLAALRRKAAPLMEALARIGRAAKAAREVAAREAGGGSKEEASS
jgi:predicted lipid carrier protein YhbT